MAFQEESMAMKPITVVSMISSRLMPSMPIMILRAQAGDPIGALHELKAGDAFVEARDQRQGNQEPGEAGQVRPDLDQVLSGATE